jgi:hypothetical protein
MKREMAMLPNGNYESIISPIQHECSSKDSIWSCSEYGWDLGSLTLEVQDGDPYEDGYENKISVKYCPFCGYQPERLNPEARKGCDSLNSVEI